ncbi:MAG: hypothetical protein OEV43_02765 [Coriobacteriia bacterium]|nr:hypothetical protein [Coriobacteriia bacterium]
MLARKDAPAERDRTTLISRAAGEVFALWRHALGRGAHLVREGAESTASLAKRYGQNVRTSLLEPTAAETEPTKPLVLVGTTALAIGIVGTVFIGRDALGQAVASAAVMALWCTARLALMTIAAEAKTLADRRAVTRAWALGLLPYVFAVSPLLQFAAWLLSIGLAFRTLEAGRFRRRRVVWCLAWGYGSQALAVVAAWLTRNAFIAGAVLER